MYFRISVESPIVHVKQKNPMHLSCALPLKPKSAEEILQMLDYGNKNRTQHPTDVNASSSRSHAVFQVR